jgi:hypothetical protein
MADPSQASDTLAVLRGIGARAIGRALARRAGATARALGRAARAFTRPEVGAGARLFVHALRRAPSPLAAVPAIDPLAVVRRAHAALAEAEPEPLEPDLRLAWEAGRGVRVVQVAAGLAAVPGDAELRRGFERLLVEWLEEHRVGDGSDPLEAGLRAWALWVAVSMAGPERLGDEAAAAAAAALVEHARFLGPRLDDRGLVVGSHLLGELVGLYACGAALVAAGEEPEGWRQAAREGLAREALDQVLLDGGGAEGSTGYARFVAELLFAAGACARAAGDPPLAEVDAAARRALGWLAATMSPDGRDPGIGDDDGSRVLPGARAVRDVAALAPLLAAGEIVTRPEDVGWSEVAGWMLGLAGRARWEAARPEPWAERFDSTAFGLYLSRRGGRGGDLVTLRAGPHGQGGAGGHAHNDTLAITVWLDGRPAIVDPGTGMYLGRPALRDRFRGIAAHAALCIDGLEPSPILATRPFALPDRAGARVVTVESGAAAWRCVAEHSGYRRVGVVHRRELRHERDARRLTVIDTLTGSGTRRVALSFPLARGEARLDGDAVDGGDVGITAGEADRDKPLPLRIDPGLVSPRYGDVAAAPVVRRVGRVSLPVTVVTVIQRR